MRLTDEELRDVLARAEEIQRASRSLRDMQAEVEAVVGAAEEMGLQRSAVELALRERLELTAPPEVGELAFAKSTDGKYYPSEVLDIKPDGVRVRFLQGSVHVVAPGDLKPGRFLPGDRVTVDWPWWGKWTCTVVSYDPAYHYVTLSDGWGDTHSCHIRDVWVEAPTEKKPARGRTRIFVAVAAGAALGSIIGSALTAFFLR